MQKYVKQYAGHARFLKALVHILSVVNARHGIEQFVAVSTVTEGEQKDSRIRSSPCSKPHVFDKQVLNRYVGLLSHS